MKNSWNTKTIVVSFLIIYVVNSLLVSSKKRVVLSALHILGYTSFGHHDLNINFNIFYHMILIFINSNYVGMENSRHYAA